METSVALDKQLEEQMETLEKSSGPKLQVPDVHIEEQDDQKESESGDQVEEPPSKAPRTSDGLVRGLSDVLQRAGLSNFKADADEPEAEILNRVRAMGPFMHFTALVRQKEGIISRASILRKKACRLPHLQLEHELALARADYMCNSQRQSRFALWAEYSERVSEVVAGLEQEEDGKDALQKVVSLKPNGGLLPDGRRVCQILLIRPFMSGGSLGPFRLGLVVCAFRGGKKGKVGKQFAWTESALPFSSSTRVHCRLLFPQGVKNEENAQLVVCSCLSPVVSLDPHDGSVVMEIPTSKYKFDYSPDYFEAWISKEVLRCMKHVGESNVQFSSKKKDAGIKTFFTEEDFARGGSATGKNIQKYMEYMKKDYESHIQTLCNPDDGSIKLTKEIVTSWPELLARSISFFKKYSKHHPHYKMMSKEMQEHSSLDF